MVDEQRELQMNVGKAMDVLQKDYPYFLRRAPGETSSCSSLFHANRKSRCHRFSFFRRSSYRARHFFSPSCPTPDYSIYHDSISLKASDGQIQLSKLSSYKQALGITRTMLSLLYDVDRSVVQSRMVYDSPRTQIRVSFNAMLVPKLGLNSLGGKTVHVDGISVYSVDLSSTLREDEHGNLSRNDGAGKIVEHRVERLLVNGLPLQPPYLSAFGLEMMSGQHAGALAGAGAWS